MSWKNNRNKKHTSDPKQRAADIADKAVAEREKSLMEQGLFPYGQERYWLDCYNEALQQFVLEELE